MKKSELLERIYWTSSEIDFWKSVYYKANHDGDNEKKEKANNYILMHKEWLHKYCNELLNKEYE